MKKPTLRIAAAVLMVTISVGCSRKPTRIPQASPTAPAVRESPLASTEEESFVNSIGMQFAFVPPGTFTMGSPEEELGRDLDERPHRVTLTKGYYMQTTEVTQGQWKAVLGNNPSHFLNCGDDCPVEQVSWNDVQEFVKALNQREKGQQYRLPSEAEWEYASRAGSPAALANGNLTEPDCCDDPQMEAMGWYVGNSEKGTHPVARKEPNAWGLYDMHGNVWEWSQDWARPYPYTDAVEPAGPETGRFKIVRGGAWNSYARFCRSAYRSRRDPGRADRHIGFRLVMSRSERHAEAAETTTAEPPPEPPAVAPAEPEPLTLPEILFDLDSSTIRASFVPMVEEVADVLRQKTGRIVVEGYTCDLGSETYNERLSARRAASVKMFLVQHGVDASRIETVSYGEYGAKYDNGTPKGRALNRRVEIRLK